MKKEMFNLSNQVCQACNGTGRENESIDADDEVDSSNECQACNGTGKED